MARRLLSDKTLRALKPAPTGGRYDVMDALVPGLGVRVTEKGQRTFILVARYPGSSNPTRRALGEYGKLTLEEAREKARRWHEIIGKGIDPKEEEQEKRTQERRRRANTFSAVTEDFIKRHLVSQRRAGQSEREIRKELLPRWKDMPITAITRQDVVLMVDEIVGRGARRQAHNVLGHARTIFNWAINRGVYGLESSPCDRLRPGQLIGPKNERQRVLSDQELALLWKAAGNLGYPYGPLFRMLVLTGQRKAEVAEARWSEFHPDVVRTIESHKFTEKPIDWSKVPNESKIWTIPPERFKSNASHRVPLTDDVLTILATLPLFKEGDHLFSTTFGNKAVNGFSKAKQRLDAEMLRLAREEAEDRGDDGSAVTIEPFVLHDIRRTMRTRLSALRVPEPVAEQVIGHARKGLARIYDQHRYLDEMREALELWAGRLRSIVQPTPANVVQIRMAQPSSA
jgi:integrase